MRGLIFILVVVGAGCGYTRLAPPPDDVGLSHVWVYRGESWGIQCGGISPPKPDVRSELARAGIEVVRFEEEGRPTCRACGCPGRSAIYYVLIPRSQLDMAKRIGFTREYGFERRLPPTESGG